jgi:hypothetical protein
MGLVLAYLPGLVALGAAILYTVGAIDKVSNVEGAGFNPQTVLQLTPIQQLLALGVSNVATPEALQGIATYVIGIGMASWWWEQRSAKRPQPAPGEASAFLRRARATERWRASVRRTGIDTPPLYPLPSRLAQWRKRAGITLGSLVLLYIVLIQKVETTVGLAVVVAALALGTEFGLRLRWRVALSLTAGLVASAIVHSASYPAPLAQVRVTTASGTVSGQLLVSTDSATTVGLSNCQIETIPAGQIRSLVIVPQYHGPLRTVADIIFGYRPHEAPHPARTCHE